MGKCVFHSILCTVDDYLLFNFDKHGLGIARIGNDNQLTYVGRALVDTDGRVLTYRMHYDGEFLYTSYRVPVADGDTLPVFRMYRVDTGE